MGESNQCVKMTKYWETLGTKYTENSEGPFMIYTVEGISPGVGLTIYQYKKWPDHDAPTTEDNKEFNQLFEKIKEFEMAGKKIIFHCRAGVGRSGTLRLMYLAWKKEISTSDLPYALNYSRALRMYTVQTQSQYNFLQEYVRAMDQSKNTTQSYADLGNALFNQKDYPQAAYWFSCTKYMVWVSHILVWTKHSLNVLPSMILLNSFF